MQKHASPKKPMPPWSLCLRVTASADRPMRQQGGMCLACGQKQRGRTKLFWRGADDVSTAKRGQVRHVCISCTISCAAHGLQTVMGLHGALQAHLSAR